MVRRLGCILTAFVRSKHRNMKAVLLIVGVPLLMCFLDVVQGTTTTPSSGSGSITSGSASGTGSGSVNVPVATTAGGNSGSQRISFTPFSVFIMAIVFIANIALA
ncbi:hypothetical protein DPMN_168558 [Dreissena polymorpha]|uniref:Uncharacterized protein n=1 Tax=Dreissena polymorpha TaxID=45954 RepID=A0A9D4F0W6_DREPO|nr:hypothetical protein DPMN_168558 [Dreissena polymorpha]